MRCPEGVPQLYNASASPPKVQMITAVWVRGVEGRAVGPARQGQFTRYAKGHAMVTASAGDRGTPLAGSGARDPSSRFHIRLGARGVGAVFRSAVVACFLPPVRLR